MIHDEHIETMRDNYDDHGAELAAKDAEIERLRSELSHCIHVDNHNAIINNRNAVIDKLREENTLLHKLARDFYSEEFIQERLGWEKR